MSGNRVGRLVVAVGLVAAVAAPATSTSARESDVPNVAYAIAVNIPEFEGQDLDSFACQLCETPTGGKSAADYLVTIDLDKHSPTYGEVIDRDAVPAIAPELHHMAIDAGTTRLALYDLYQNEANIFDVATSPTNPRYLRTVDLGEISRTMLGTVDGLVDGNGDPVAVGYATPHVSYRMPNGNHLIAMGAVYAPEVPEIHLGAPGGFIEMTPDGTVVRAFPELTYDPATGGVTNGSYDGKGVFSVDYDERLGMLAHADLMTSRQFLCGGVALAPNPADFGTQVTLWDLGGPNAADPEVAQVVEIGSPIVTAPAFVHHAVDGKDIVFVSSFTTGLWVLHRPTGTDEPFQAVNVYGSEGFGLVHMRLHPTNDVLYISDPYGDRLHVLDFGDDPLHPEVLQQVPVDEVHMMKFTDDGKYLYISNGLASILSFTFNGQPFSPDYGLMRSRVHGDGRLGPPQVIFDASTEPDAPQGVFIGDFFLRRNPQAPV